MRPKDDGECVRELVVVSAVVVVACRGGVTIAHVAVDLLPSFGCGGVGGCAVVVLVVGVAVVEVRGRA